MAQALWRDLAEWGPRGKQKAGPVDALWLGLVIGAPAVLAGLVLGLFVGWIAAAVAVLLLAGTLCWWLASRPGSVLRQIGARPLDRAEAPRLVNLATGMATDLGLQPPAVWVVEEGGPNALVGRSKTPVIAVTRALLDSYTRTELEGVVAHCLLRLDPSLLRRSSLAASLGEASGPLGSLDLEGIDARATALTRYPPGLAAAVEKADPRSGRSSSFWFVPDSGRLARKEHRAALLRDL